MKIATAKYQWIKDYADRMDASYHLSEGRRTKLLMDNSPYPVKELREVTSRVFMGPRFKRYYVKSTETGVPFMGGADMQKADLSELKLISKKMTRSIEELYIEKNWTMVTRSGTIGKTVFTNEDFEGKTATEDVIRIVGDETKIKPGFLHAFLASNYGYILLTQSTYGAVIQHIEPHHIQNLPIPIFPEDQQQHIHDLIMRASALRVEGNRLLREAIAIIGEKLPKLSFEKTYKTKVSTFKLQRIRMDATSHLTSINGFYEDLEKTCTIKSIGDLSSNVFTPNIFKRMRVDNPKRGIPFFGGANLLEAHPKFNNFLSRRMKNISNYQLKERWLAIQDSGSLSSMGYVSIIPKYLHDVAATNNLIRVIPKVDKDYNPYIYAFLKTSSAQQIIKSNAYGTAQLHIDNNQIKKFKVPIFDDIFETVTQKVDAYLNKIDTAFNLENQAIQTIEKTIASWHT